MGWGAQLGCFETWGCSSEKFIPIAAPSMSEAVALEKMTGIFVRLRLTSARTLTRAAAMRWRICGSPLFLPWLVQDS